MLRGQQFPEVAFWSNLIITLGLQRPGQIDISDPNINPDRVRFDPIQRELILMRLVGDVMLVEHSHQAKNASGEKAVFQKASYVRELPAADDGGGCTLNNNQSAEADYAAIAAGQVFSKLAGALDNIVGSITGSSVVGSYIKKAGAANIILNLLKFVATYAALEIDLSMDGGPNLTRTKTRAPGERKRLTGHVHINTDGWANLANCARPVLNFLGFDFSLPGDGDLTNVKVTFVLQAAGDDLDAIAHNANLGAYFGDTNTTYSEPIGGVRLEPVTQRAQFTDSKGMASITMIGEPQDRDLSHEKLTENRRAMGVSAFVATKTTDPQNKGSDVSQWAGTIGDYFGPFVSLITGDELGAALGAATETLYRAAWFGSDVFPFMVKDWRGCGECWSGTISMKSTFNVNDSSKTAETSSSKTYTRTIDETVTITTDMDGVVTSTAIVSDNGSGQDEKNGIDICHRGINGDTTRAPWTSSTKRTDSAGGTVKAYPSISVQGSHVTIGIETDPLPRALGYEEKHTNGCYTDRLNGSNAGTFNTMDPYPIRFSGDGQPTRENTAHGSVTIKDATGGTTTYKWDLSRQ